MSNTNNQQPKKGRNKKSLVAMVKDLFKKSPNANQNAKKEQLKTALTLVAIGVVCYGVYLYMSQPVAQKHKAQPHLAGALDDNVGLNYDHEMIKSLTDQLDATNSKLSKLSDAKAKSDSKAQMQLDATTLKQMEAMQNEIKQLKQQITQGVQQTKTITATTKSTKDGGGHAFENAPSKEDQAKKSTQTSQQQPMISTLGIDDVSITYPEAAKKAQERSANNYVWAGTFATGYLMTGIIGDAGTNSTKNTGTVAIKLTANGTMPNGKTSHLKDCVVLGSTYGDLSADSDVIHLETLSCAGKKYSFEKKVYGAVFDLDAMQDLRGVPVLKAKPVLGYAAVAGLIAGIGDGLSASGNTSTVTGSGVVTTPTSVLKSGIGQGISKPADKITDYLMAIANMYHPIVVARAGRKVTVLFQAGFWIDKAHQGFESMKSIDSGSKVAGDGDAIKQTTTSALSTAQQQINQGNQSLANSTTPDDITKQVAQASGDVKAMAEKQANDAFNANQLKLGQGLFTPIQK